MALWFCWPFNKSLLLVNTTPHNICYLPVLCHSIRLHVVSDLICVTFPTCPYFILQFLAFFVSLPFFFAFTNTLTFLPCPATPYSTLSSLTLSVQWVLLNAPCVTPTRLHRQHIRLFSTPNQQVAVWDRFISTISSFSQLCSRHIFSHMPSYYYPLYRCPSTDNGPTYNSLRTILKPAN